MAIPILIDTDLGVDDAAAVCLAVAGSELELRGIVGVGGCVELDQVMVNVGRVLLALAPKRMPAIGRGLDQTGTGLLDRRKVFGRDGLGECDLPPAKALAEDDFRSVYRRAIEASPGELVIVATGPLTNLAAMWTEAPDILRGVKQIFISGGVIRAKGDVSANVEFNFYRAPAAAAAILSSGLPITVAPLDVTNLISLDESHVARLAACGARAGEVLAKPLEFAVSHEQGPGRGKTHVSDAVTVGSVLWPGMFMRTRTRLEVETSGKDAGRCKPVMGGDAAQRVDLLTAVNAVDLLENLLESLCNEAFIV